MNDDIMRYLRQICPCKAVLDLYEEVLNDIRAEKFKGVNKEKIASKTISRRLRFVCRDCKIGILMKK